MISGIRYGVPFNSKLNNPKPTETVPKSTESVDNYIETGVPKYGIPYNPSNLETSAYNPLQTSVYSAPIPNISENSPTISSGEIIYINNNLPIQIEKLKTIIESAIIILDLDKTNNTIIEMAKKILEKGIKDPEE